MEGNVHFENKYRLDYATFVKVYRVAGGRFRTFFLIFGVVMLLLSLLVQVLGAPINPALWMLLLLLLLFMAGSPLLNAYFAARQHRQLMNGAVEDATAIYTDSEIILHAGKNESHIVYPQLTRVVNLKDCWMLLISRTVMIPVPKDRFTQGSAADFPAFIREKCPQIKGKFN